MDGMPRIEQLIEMQLQDTADPEVRLQILSYRVAVLTREKEAMEKRLKKIEDAYTMGKGVFWALPIIGIIIGYITANWGWITKPWTPTR